MISSNRTGVWKREMTAGGVFLHRCEVNNTIGTTKSTHISVSVNGKYIYIYIYIYKCGRGVYLGVKCSMLW